MTFLSLPLSEKQPLSLFQITRPLISLIANKQQSTTNNNNPLLLFSLCFFVCFSDKKTPRHSKEEMHHQKQRENQHKQTQPLNKHVLFLCFS